MPKSVEDRMNELERIVKGQQERIKDLESKVKELEDRQNMASGLLTDDGEHVEDDEDDGDLDEEEDEEDETSSV